MSDSKTKWFTPAKGLRIIDPQTRREVPADGQWVRETNEFYQRRVTDKDGAFSDQAPADHVDQAADET